MELELSSNDLPDSDSIGSPHSPVDIEMRLRQRIDTISSIEDLDFENVFVGAPGKATSIKSIQTPLLVLEVTDKKVHRFVEVNRADILEDVRRVVPMMVEADVAPKSGSPSFTRMVSKRYHAEGPSSKAFIERERFKGALQKRDIRLLDSNFSHSKDPVIIVRRHAVIVNIEPIKALILHNRCLLFIPDGADSLLHRFMELINEQDDGSVFSIRALEAILISVTDLLQHEMSVLRPEVESTLHNVLETQSGVTLERLRQSKSSVAKSLNRLAGIQAAFEELLENDSDMALMNLSKVQNSPEMFIDVNESEWSADHQDTELLLENYAQAVDGIIGQVSHLQQELEAAISSITLRLDTARNKLLGIELLISSFTAAAAIGALFAGLFGMNLHSGVEETPRWFWGWFIGIMVAVPILVSIMFTFIIRSGLLIN